MNNEVWLDIPGFEGRYCISSYGRVKSISKRKGAFFLKIFLGTAKYPQVNLYRVSDKKQFTRRLNRLVAQSFLGLDINNSKIFACHKDDDPLNCRADNLFLGTPKDNTQDMISKGRMVKHGNPGEKNKKSKLKDYQIIEIRHKYKTTNCNQTSLAKEYGVSQPMIGCIVRGDNWTHV